MESSRRRTLVAKQCRFNPFGLLIQAERGLHALRDTRRTVRSWTAPTSVIRANVNAHFRISLRSSGFVTKCLQALLGPGEAELGGSAFQNRSLGTRIDVVLSLRANCRLKLSASPLGRFPKAADVLFRHRHQAAAMTHSSGLLAMTRDSDKPKRWRPWPFYSDVALRQTTVKNSPSANWGPPQLLQ